MRRCFFLIAILICFSSATSLHAADSAPKKETITTKQETKQELTIKYQKLKQAVDSIQKKLATLQIEQNEFHNDHERNLESHLLNIKTFVNGAKERDEQHATWMNLLLVTVTVAVAIISIIIAGASLYFYHNTKAKLEEVRVLADNEIKSFKQKLDKLNSDIATTEKYSASLQQMQELTKSELKELHKISKSKDLPSHIILAAKATEAFAKGNYAEAYTLYAEASTKSPQQVHLINACRSALRLAISNLYHCNDTVNRWLDIAQSTYSSAQKRGMIAPVDQVDFGIIFSLRAKVSPEKDAITCLNKAIEIYSNILESAPHDPNVKENLGEAFCSLAAYKKGDERKKLLDEAEKEFLEALAIENKKASYNLACLYCFKGDIPKCKELLTDAVQIEGIQSSKLLRHEPSLKELAKADPDWFKNFLDQVDMKNK